MKLSCCTDSLGHLAFEDMLDYLSARGVKAVEMTTGGWSSAPHVRMDELIASAEARKTFLGELSSRGMEIAALNCSGNPLDPSEMGQDHKAVSFKTMELAGLLGVKKIVMMSGLPPACSGGSSSGCSSVLPSRCRYSPSTPGFRMPTSRRRPRSASCWLESC